MKWPFVITITENEEKTGKYLKVDSTSISGWDALDIVLVHLPRVISILVDTMCEDAKVSALTKETILKEIASKILNWVEPEELETEKDTVYQSVFDKMK